MLWFALGWERVRQLVCVYFPAIVNTHSLIATTATLSVFPIYWFFPSFPLLVQRLLIFYDLFSIFKYLSLKFERNQWLCEISFNNVHHDISSYKLAPKFIRTVHQLDIYTFYKHARALERFSMETRETDVWNLTEGNSFFFVFCFWRRDERI